MPSPKDEMKQDDMPTAVIKPAQALPAVTTEARTTTGKPYDYKFCGILLVLSALILGLGLGLGLRKGEPTEEKETPIAVDFSTGVSLVTYYGIETVVRSRLASTTVTLDVANALDCSSIHSITLQLPKNARITGLETISEDCVTRGQVQQLQEARETFLEAAADGLPSAYIEEQDYFTHGLQVAIPPLGMTRVELELEELLQQRLGKVEFHMPLAPNEAIDQIVVDLSVHDLNQEEAIEFNLDLPNEIIALGRDGDSRMLNVTNTTEEEVAAENQTLVSHFRLDIADAREFDLPKVLRGWFHPSGIRESGLLTTDGKCFEHYFLPRGDPMPRNVMLLLDTTGGDEDVFKGVKHALYQFIDTLMPQDFLSIQTYGEKGSLDLWGPSAMKGKEDKAEARSFVNATGSNRWGDTDVQEAFLEALLRAKRDADKFGDDAANILVALSSNWATNGERNRAKIVTNIYKLNKEGKVKMYTIGFPRDPDVELLDAIAAVNGGVSTSVVDGSTNISSQIFNFLQNEIGTILLADVTLEVSGEGAAIYGETQHVFPLLAYGSEIAVRGLIETGDAPGTQELQALTTADTRVGKKNWTTNAARDFYVSTSGPAEISLCFQSYAHERITQLMRLRDVSKFMESSTVSSLVSLADGTCDIGMKFPECLGKEALDLAIRANVVVKGLTAMVTIDDENCLSFEEETEVCLDGTTPGDGPVLEHAEGAAFSLSSSMLTILFYIIVTVLLYFF